ncbi:protein YrbN [Candidatus Erwinia haradaeae]|uniref:Uncharacterized protein YrbN n=1 Tax=Candidatus Erwinia haradaeae TaxID=1922217 RepID=A0A451D314_9GAMM|nr:Uncharacterized protein YrbN [Candidatus Erwinia haradaeae]
MKITNNFHDELCRLADESYEAYVLHD